MSWFGRFVGAGLLGAGLVFAPMEGAAQTSEDSLREEVRRLWVADQQRESERERALEDGIGAEIIHAYDMGDVPAVRRSHNDVWSDAVSLVDDTGFTDWNDGLVYVIADELEGSTAGLYESVSFETEYGAVGGVAYVDQEYSSIGTGRVKDVAAIMVHEQMHHRHAGLERDVSDGLVSCFQEASGGFYVGDGWDDVDPEAAWEHGHMTAYSAKDPGEDAASTATRLVVGPELDGTATDREFDYGQLRSELDSTSAYEGWERLHRKASCLQEAGMLTEREATGAGQNLLWVLGDLYFGGKTNN